jgi:O-acetyl-ADP-ribose deacetylase (regulator of RNase III)
MVICHVCNDIGKWGAGFVLALSAKFPKSEQEYRDLYKATAPANLKLGTVQFVSLDDPIVKSDGLKYVANMIAQRGTHPSRDGSQEGCPPIRYNALLSCLDEVGKFAQKNGCSVHGPRFGSGLAGGKWEIIEGMIERTLIGKYGLTVTIYDPATK